MEVLLVADVVAEVCAAQVVHEEVEVAGVLEGAVHVDQEGVVQLAEDAPLVQHAPCAPFLQHSE